MSDPTPQEIVVTGAKITGTRAPGAPTFHPQIQVTLRKTIQRAGVGSVRFSGAKPTVDLTPYLGLDSTVTVSKSVREAAGMFSITFPDQVLKDVADSAYGFIEPMDMVEIRIARDASIYAGQGLPIMMRGFVADIRRSQNMTPSGPQRLVTLSGQDYGRILSIVRPVYLMGVDPSADLITTFGLFDNYGVSPDYVSPQEFMQQVMDKVVNKGSSRVGFLANLQSQSATSPVQFIATDLYEDNADQVSPIGSNGWRGGSIMDLFKAFCDVGAFFELYIEDRVDGPYLVYRPTPFRDLNGVLIQGGDPPKLVKIPSSNIVNLDVGRTDANVANYYNVTAGRFQLIDASWMQAAAINTDPASIFLADYPNSDPSLYGVRQMDADTEMGLNYGGLAADKLDKARSDGLNIVAARRKVLIANNRDNVVLESGMVTVRGDEALRAGCEVRLIEGQGAVPSDYYAPQMTHQFIVGRSYTTSLTLERGTGFVDRTGKDVAPYYAEQDIRGVYA
jgi:hypothetical protein